MSVSCCVLCVTFVCVTFVCVCARPQMFMYQFMVNRPEKVKAARTDRTAPLVCVCVRLCE